ncbi:MAG: S41 family peptidase [Tannerella sp.]|jgi:C-terminal processing protease CtpA/Prc|nr:S41 family peptidase [Tannerella sp.]
MKTGNKNFLQHIFSYFPGGRLPVFLTLTVLLLLATGCEKADVYTMNPKANFDALWRIIDEHYCFFEYKNVDWNEVYRKYDSQLSDTLNKYELFDLLGNMLAELKDGHTNLMSSFDVARYWAWYENYPRNFNEDIHKLYLGQNYRIAGGIKYQLLADDKIGYMFYESFSSSVSDSGLNEVFMHFKDCKGLIIDVRENGGGSLGYSDRIASRFLDRDTVVGYIIHKTGPGHNDFSKLYPIELTPSKYTRWLRPVVVLTNRHSYSATNDFVNKMRNFPQVTIMGDRTGGGGGLPFNSELPNGWRVRFSASPLLDIDKQCAEDGIEPDVKVALQSADVDKGKDTLIESAIAFLLKD